MIRAEQLQKTFAAGPRKAPVRALTDVSFEARDGQITGLLGPNGAGKSTSLRILAGLIRPDRGRAWLDGTDLLAQPLRARHSLGYLPHNAGLYPRLTSRENLCYYGELCGLSGGQAARRAAELIEQLDIGPFADRRAEGFSQGQRTRVALGRALIHRPRTLVLDEPTNGLDVMATRKLRAILRQLCDQGHCVLVSSHIMQEVVRLCDRVAIISDGRVAIDDSVAGILERTGQDDMEEAFVAAIGANTSGREAM